MATSNVTRSVTPASRARSRARLIDGSWSSEPTNREFGYSCARHPDAEGFVERAGVKVTIDPRGKISRQVRYRPVETDGAARAAACLAELI